MSNRPEQFIQTSDYATLKNDDRQTTALNIPVGATIPAFGFIEYSTTAEIGTINASTRVQMSTSGDPGAWTPGNMREVILQVKYNTTGSPIIDYYQVVNIERVSPSTVKMYVRITNPLSFSITVVGSVTTVTADIATFLSPFN